MCATRLDAEKPRAAKSGQAGREARVHLNPGKLLVIEAGAAHGPEGQLETERLHQVQRRAAVGGEADDVAGVGRNLGLEQHNVVHGRLRR